MYGKTGTGKVAEYRDMKLKIYQVDAFASEVFKGNPAAVCLPDKWPADDLMQSIAAENNLSETVFAVRAGQRFEIRWFTPRMEVELCGHATLAAAHVLFEHHGYLPDLVEFYSGHSGRLTVERSGDSLTLDFPVDQLEEIKIPGDTREALRKSPLKAFRGKSDFMFIFASQAEIEEIAPDFDKLLRMDCRGVIVTAMGLDVDFVSRFFAPRAGIKEDPVTGSAHTTLTPYWARVLGKKKLFARQLSERGGELVCEILGERVKISGKAVTYMEGEIMVSSTGIADVQGNH